MTVLVRVLVGLVLVQMTVQRLVESAPTTDSITPHLADGTASYQRAVYETGALINDQIRNGAQAVQSGVSQWDNAMGNFVRTPFSFLSTTFRSRMPSTFVPQFVTSATETVRSIPSAVEGILSTVGTGIWNTSSYTVNAFGRSLVVKGVALERYAEFLKNSGRSIEDYQWIRVPKNSINM